jgi:23S rRNA pseudouridine955/2504/2580 synthase
MINWKVEQADRLLTEVKKRLANEYTSKEVRWLIEHNHCFVNDRMERFGSTPLKKGDLITIHPNSNRPQGKDLNRILFEDSAILVYDKPPFISSEQVAESFQHRLPHRLDRDTTGLLLLAKTESAQISLEQLFRERKIEKEYLVWVEGILHEKGIVSGKMAPIHRQQGAVIWGFAEKGVWSQTQWSCVAHRKKTTLVLCKPLTGRTHQIRLHLASIGHPVIGDPVYGTRQKTEKVLRPLLHASLLSVIHPTTHEKMTFSSPPPPDFPIAV